MLILEIEKIYKKNGKNVKINNMENNEVNHTPQTAQEMLLSVAIGIGLVALSLYLFKKSYDILKK